MTDALTIEAFADWAEKQPAGRTYEWSDTGGCACAQYADAIGDRGCGHTFWHDAQRIALGGNISDWTFGKLAKRLRTV